MSEMIGREGVQPPATSANPGGDASADRAEEVTRRLREAASDLAYQQAKLLPLEDERNCALRELHRQGWGYDRLSRVAGISKARVQQILTRKGEK